MVKCFGPPTAKKSGRRTWTPRCRRRPSSRATGFLSWPRMASWSCCGPRASFRKSGERAIAGQIPRQPGLCRRAHLPARRNQPVLPRAGRPASWRNNRDACPTLTSNLSRKRLQRIGRKPEALIPILQALQEHHGWLPPEALERLVELTDIRPSAISGVSTFYDMFRHQAGGQTYCPRLPRHGLSCRGRGAGGGRLAAALEHPSRRRHRCGAPVHHRTSRLPRLLHAGARGEDGRRDVGILLGGENPGQNPRYLARQTGGQRREVHRGNERRRRQWLRPNPRRPGFLLHGQGQRPVVSRLARKRRPMRRPGQPSSASVAWACAIARR